MRRLEGKIALITGAGSGMGKNTALLFAKEGAQLSLLDVKEAELEETTEEIKKLGGQAYMMVGDVSKAEDVDTWVKNTISKYGEINILLNNAGVYIMDPVPGCGNFYDATERTWDRTMEINLKGPWLCCKAVIPYMLRHKKGKIINIASADGLIGILEPLAYVCSKHGVVGLTRALAVDLAPKGINVNAICPADVDTPMVQEVAKQLGPIEGWDFGIRSLIPTPIPIDGVSKLSLFLASDDSDYLHGRSIHVGAWAALIP